MIKKADGKIRGLEPFDSLCKHSLWPFVAFPLHWWVPTFFPIWKSTSWFRWPLRKRDKNDHYLEIVVQKISNLQWNFKYWIGHFQLRCCNVDVYWWQAVLKGWAFPFQDLWKGWHQDFYKCPKFIHLMITLDSNFQSSLHLVLCSLLGLLLSRCLCLHWLQHTMFPFLWFPPKTKPHKELIYVTFLKVWGTGGGF